jgi:cytoskeletal protein CcmA (bactofilin family)
MFGKKSNPVPQGRIDSLIGVGTCIEGNISFSGGLRIDGVVKGNVAAAPGATSSTLIVSEHATIEGEVNVAHLVINGTVQGRVVVTETLEMESKAKIIGDVNYSLIEMHQGAIIEGHLLHRDGKSSLSAEQKPEIQN